MNKINIILASFLFIFSSCSNTEKKQTNHKHNVIKESNPIQISISPSSGKIIVGDQIEIEVISTNTINIDSVFYYINNELINTEQKSNTKLELATSKYGIGRKNIKVTSYIAGKSHVRITSISVLPKDVAKNKSYKIINTYPHDNQAYTQGLIFVEGFLYESTGLNNKSTIRKVNLLNGEIIQSLTVNQDVFGEGITIFQDKIIQLTWQAHKGFVYDKNTFKLLHEFSYASEGWGLTHNDKRLIMSDGTNILYFLEPQTYTVTSSIEVFDNEGPVMQLNELEYFNDKIYANIYQSDKIAEIDPNTGIVLAYINLANILPDSDYSRDTDVLNGIAYDKTTKKIYVTGKKWSKLFEIQIY